MSTTLKLDSYYEWCLEKIRIRAREAQGTGGDVSILLAIIDSLLKQADIEIVGDQYKALTAALRAESRVSSKRS